MKINILSFTVLLAFITLSHAEMVKDISGEKITIPKALLSAIPGQNCKYKLHQNCVNH